MITVFTFAELVRPTPHRVTLYGRMLNIVIGLIVSVFAFLLTLVVDWLAMRVWRDDVIGRLFPGWRSPGFFGLTPSVFV